MSVLLYYAPGSCAFASLIALEETGVEYEARPVRLAEGEQKAPEYLVMHPRGQVPLLKLRDGYVRENIAVLSYIANSHPTSGLLPLDEPFLLAKGYEFLSWFATNLHVSIAQLWRGERFTDDEGVKAALKEAGLGRFVRALAALDEWARAFDGPWILGDRFTVTDALVPVVVRWAGRLDIDVARHPALEALNHNVLARPATQRAIEREQRGLVAPR